MTLNNPDFGSRSQAALDRLNRSLGPVADEHDVEVLLQNGVLVVETEEPHAGKIVISPNSSAGQIWISAQMRSFKLDWTTDGWVLAATGEVLDQLVGRLIGEQLGVPAFKL